MFPLNAKMVPVRISVNSSSVASTTMSSLELLEDFNFLCTDQISFLNMDPGSKKRLGLSNRKRKIQLPASPKIVSSEDEDTGNNLSHPLLPVKNQASKLVFCHLTGVTLLNNAYYSLYLSFYSILGPIT